MPDLDLTSAETATTDSPKDGNRNLFWDFSLRVYTGERVPEACLALQNERGADVNIALLCCFLGFSGIRIDREAVEKIDTLVAGWRAEAITPLRTLRQALKQAIGPVLAVDSEVLRSQIKSAELEAERLEQQVLFQALERLPGKNARDAEPSGVARMNLREYVDFLGISREESRAAVEPLILAIRDVLEAEEIEEAAEVSSEDGGEDEGEDEA